MKSLTDNNSSIWQKCIMYLLEIKDSEVLKLAHLLETIVKFSGILWVAW